VSSESSAIDYKKAWVKVPLFQAQNPQRMGSNQTVQSVFFRNFKRTNTAETKELTKKIANLDDETHKLLKNQMASYSLKATKLFEIRNILSSFERDA
jgi:hypothetical protein